MPTLNRQLRKHLEKVVIDARRAAEEGAAKALESLAVVLPKPWRSLSPEQQALRNRLRARARQLGDRRNAKVGTQEIERLLQECAYEHWHRMLFARFLAENELLIEPESGVAISLEDCRELAREQGTDWMQLAARYAVRMLPQVFRTGDPVLEVALALETRKELERLLELLPAEVFQADDSLGWTYQFWQAERKNEVNASGKKIGAEELPAVTQLFTEDYMVEFVLHNTLGAWWAGKFGPLAVATEEDARAAVAFPPLAGFPDVTWTYLRFVQSEDGLWRPAAGTFPKWPREARLIKFLDPCMGSGHFVVFALPLIARMRMQEEAMSSAGAVYAALRDNLFGLELDERCTQIGAFNLALAAWKLSGHQSLPPLHIACSGLAPNVSQEHWIALAGDSDRLQRGMTRLYTLFSDAPTLGSLINPRAVAGDLIEADFHELQPVLAEALRAEKPRDDDRVEMGVVAQGLAKAAEILAGQFVLVATNVPYLGRGKQDKVLKAYCERAHARAKADLATCFVERSLAFCASGGTAALVTPQSWFYLGTYKQLRAQHFANDEWHSVARLGARAFETISGEVVNVALVAISQSPPDPSHHFMGLDVSGAVTAGAKAAGLISTGPQLVRQKSQLQNPDAALNFTDTAGTLFLSQLAYCYQGTSTGDNPRFTRTFWELPAVERCWEFFQMPPGDAGPFVGKESIVNWGALADGFEGAAIRGGEAWGKVGIAFGQMTDLPATFFLGTKFSNSCPVLVPSKREYLLPIWAFCRSGSLTAALRRFNQKLSVDNGYITKVPFDLTYWQGQAAEQYPNGLPQPRSDDPTQWLFTGDPKTSAEPLQVAVIRLLGYRWPRQMGSSFPECPSIAPDGLEAHADVDGIVCLPALRNEVSAADRLATLLANAFGAVWSAPKHDELLAQVEFPGATLGDWLQDGFFEQHSKLFHYPFIWHIWDGLRGGFGALLNYHKLVAPNGEGRKLLEKLSHTYVGDWLTRQRAEQKQGVEGADARVAAAVHLKAQLDAILEGEPPYDLFVRWKPLHEQSIGWEPDTNNGVRLNIRPFMMAETFNGRSIFRKPPNIKWGRDRGTEADRPKADFPWKWDWDEGTVDFPGGRTFDGKRWNDLHYTRAFKQEARERHAREAGRCR